jgi:hypothetical protein
LHTGDSLGIEATNKSVEFTGITMLRVRDGQIVEAWNNFDFLKLSNNSEPCRRDVRMRFLNILEISVQWEELSSLTKRLAAISR